MSKRTPNHPGKVGLVLTATAALTLACSGSETSPSPEMSQSSVARITPGPGCGEAVEAIPLYADFTVFRDDLNGVNGSDKFRSAWDFVQQSVEESLSQKKIPAGSRVKVSAAIGPMTTRSEESEAALIEGDAVGNDPANPDGQLTDSQIYRFERDTEELLRVPSVPLGALALRFQPVVNTETCYL